MRQTNNVVERDNRKGERQDEKGKERVRESESKREAGEISSCQLSCISLHFVCPCTVCQLEGRRDAPCRLSNKYTPTAGPVERGVDESRKLNTHNSQVNHEEEREEERAA